MVSQPHSPIRALSVRGPPSISSRTTTGRRHRHNRSHNGGSTYQPQNEFPYFGSTGDVEIVINAGAQENRYLLHRLILAQCSGFFEAGTSEEWARAQAHTQSQGHSPTHRLDNGLASIGEDEVAGLELDQSGSVPGSEGRRKTRWRYELDWGNTDDELPMLVQKVSLRMADRGESELTDSRRHPRQHCSAANIPHALLPSATNPHHHKRDSFGPWQTFPRCSLQCNLPSTYRIQIRPQTRPWTHCTITRISSASFTTIHPCSMRST